MIFLLSFDYQKLLKISSTTNFSFCIFLKYNCILDEESPVLPSYNDNILILRLFRCHIIIQNKNWGKFWQKSYSLAKGDDLYSENSVNGETPQIVTLGQQRSWVGICRNDLQIKLSNDLTLTDTVNSFVFTQPRNKKNRTETHKFRKMHSNFGHLEL